ncbi:MAG TPA: NUDIX hydrolase [Candidatus Saccharimonadia bacterium]|nr:NUDIX hydrolase [Candidatus Saccharimonadia bacterium]
MTASVKKRVMVTGVLGLAVNEKGEYLLTQRNQPKDPEVHMLWQIPGGGMEFGEQPEQTLSREMQEELGVAVRILHPLPVAKTSVWILKTYDLHVTLLCYLVSIDDQTPKINDPETANFGWYSIQNMHDLKLMALTGDFVEAFNRQGT